MKLSCFLDGNQLDQSRMQPTVTFDYNQLDRNGHRFVLERTKEIRLLMKRSAEDIVTIGLKLMEIKRRLPHGAFGKWLRSEFDWTENTALNFMRVAKAFKTTNFADLQLAPSALYLLAAPSTPDEARFEAVKRASDGENITYGQAVSIVQSYRLPDNFDIGTKPQRPSDKTINNTHSLQLSTSNEWYTPPQYLTAVREVMGSIDLDPASNEIANKVVRAATYFSIVDDGLSRQWWGRIFLNPPYGIENGVSNQAKWSDYLIKQYRGGKIEQAILLVNAVPSNKWFAPLWAFPICFTNHRIKFYSEATISEQPTHSNAFVYMGANEAKFVRVFSQFGTVAKKVELLD